LRVRDEKSRDGSNLPNNVPLFEVIREERRSMSERVRFDFSGLDVIVTGGTSGIGAATARAFSTAGARVVATGTRNTEAEYPDFPKGVGYRKLQLEREASIQEFAASVKSIDILINNAGHIMPQASFAESVQVNLNAVYQLSAALQARLAVSKLENGGSIVNIASMMSFFGSPYMPGYGAAKAGVVQLTKTLAAAWAKDNIRVNAVAAGSVPTKMTSQYANDPHWSKVVSDGTPMARWGKPEELAAPILFLCSPAASFITGHTVVVDGGYSIID